MKRRIPPPSLVALDGGRSSGRIRRGVDAQIKSQRSDGELNSTDEGLITLARLLADTLDAEFNSVERSGYTIAVLSGRLQGLLTELRGRRQPIAAPVSDDPDLDALRAALGDAARSRQTDAR